MSNYISDKAKLGKDITFAKSIIIEDDVTVGDNCQLGYNVVIRKGTTIGDNVRIDDNTVIGKYPMKATLSIFKEELNLPPTHIGNNCLVGANTVILPGKTIGEDALIAAGSIVTKDVPPRKIVMGSPAWIIRDVPQEQLIENQKFYVK